ncbi:MAG TPA: acyltransferase [Rudaea sp.]
MRSLDFLRRFRLKTLSEALEQREDSFLLLRFLAASLVIYGHAPSITGGGGPQDLFLWLNWGEYSGSIAVDLFFIISGFLITGSFVRRQKLIEFLWARFLRIFPPLLVCLLVSAFLLGPLVTELPIADYFRDPDTTAYVSENIKLDLALRWTLPGVFTHNPKNPAVNGSIWTLPAEVRMYVWLAAFGLLGSLTRKWWFNLLFIAAVLFGIEYPSDIPLLPLADYVRFAVLFGAGAFCYVNRGYVPVSGVVLSACILLSFLLRETRLYPVLFAASEVAFVFWFAYNFRWGRAFNRAGDYSYGVYLYGFPSQQLVAYYRPGLSILANACCGLALALCMAIASWHLIEKPSLRWKNLPRTMRQGIQNLLGRYRNRMADNPE